jgi:hypothetical protein
MGKKSFIMGLLAEAALESAVRNERSNTVYTVPSTSTPAPAPRRTYVTSTPQRGSYSTPATTTTYGCHGNGRPQFSSYSSNYADDRIVVSYDTAVSLFRRIAVAVGTSRYSHDYARRMGRELAYLISEGRSSGWKDDFRKSYDNIRELRQVCDEFGIRVVVHGSDYEYERLFEELDRVLSSDDVRID